MKLLKIKNLKNLIFHPIFVIFFLNVIFFSNPIFKGLYISPSDSLQRFPSFNLGEFHKAENSLLFDAVTQFQPWYVYAKSEFAEGRLPIWNPHNAGGVPFFANNISALLFPPSILFYFLDLRIALICFYFVKLLLIGIFTYLFLRQLGMKRESSLLGAVAFNFAGFNIVWLLWPQTNVIIFFPLFLLLIEAYLNSKLENNKFYLFFSITLLLAFTAGHPETLFQILILSIGYFIYRLKTGELPVKEKLLKTKFIFLGSISGFLLSGIITFPFLEYLINSYTVTERITGIQKYLLSLNAFIYNLFPNIAGNPSAEFYQPVFNSNYNESAGGYSGLLIFVSAVLSVILIRKKGKFNFFVYSSLAVLPFIYNFPVLNLITAPVNQVIGTSRLLFYIAFCQAVLAALFVENIHKLKNLKKIIIPGILITLIMIPLLISVLHKFILEYSAGNDPLKVAEFIKYSDKQVIFMLVTLSAGLLVLFWLNVKPKLILIPVVLIVLIIFLQTGYMNRNYNPSIEKKYFFPENETIGLMKFLPEGKYIELGGDSIIPPDINLAYNLSSVSNYDALDIREYKNLFNRSFIKQSEWGTVYDTNEASLFLFGIKYVISYTDIDKKIVFNNIKPVKYDKSADENKYFSLNFDAEDGGLTAIRLLPVNFNRSNNCTLVFELYRSGNNEKIYSKNIPCKNLPDKIYYQFDFPPILDSSDSKFNLQITQKDGDITNFISFWKDEKGELVFNTIYDYLEKPYLELIYNGKFKVYEYIGAPEEYYLTGIYSDFRIVKSSALYKEIITDSDKESELLSTNAYYPGWRVYIDGKTGKIGKYKNTFQAVEIPPGAHKIQIVYWPFSFFAGLVSTLTGVMLVFILYGKKNNS